MLRSARKEIFGMGRRAKGAPKPVKSLGKNLDDIILEWEYEGCTLQVRHVAHGGPHGAHVRLVKTGDSFDRELSRVFVSKGWQKDHLLAWGQAAFELTFPALEEGFDNDE
jgi:hypothetical protein